MGVVSPHWTAPIGTHNPNRDPTDRKPTSTPALESQREAGQVAFDAPHSRAVPAALVALGRPIEGWDPYPGAGNFSSSRRITRSAGPRRYDMQEALPAIVLTSEAKRTAMNDEPAQRQPISEFCRASDERLMLAFSQG